eukprot:3713190-Prymnesium_polylepis.3
MRPAGDVYSTASAGASRVDQPAALHQPEAAQGTNELHTATVHCAAAVENIASICECEITNRDHDRTSHTIRPRIDDRAPIGKRGASPIDPECTTITGGTRINYRDIVGRRDGVVSEHDAPSVARMPIGERERPYVKTRIGSHRNDLR